MTLNAAGEATWVKTDCIAAVQPDEAVAMAQGLQAAGKTRGYSGSYKYLAQTLDDGSARYIFLDCTRSLNSFRSFLGISALVSLGGLGAALRQLCSILADNAVKYAQKNATISFRLRQKGRRVYLSCENQAEGLTRGSYDRLFDRFYRADASRSQVQGYGIGLSLARAIVTAHGGKISAESPDGASLVVTAVL